MRLSVAVLARQGFVIHQAWWDIGYVLASLYGAVGVFKWNGRELVELTGKPAVNRPKRVS